VGTLRCLISNIPQKLLSDIVLDSVQQHLDIEVVADAIVDVDIPALVKKESVDVLLLGFARDRLPKICNQLFISDPNLLVVGLVDDGRGAAIFVNDIGPGELVDLISTLRPDRTGQHMK
jgi:hypothetical protein